MGPRALVRWSVHHGLVRLALRRAARAGDLHACSILDPAFRADPYPLYDAVRERGRLVRGRLAYLTATHPIAEHVLRSEDFRAGADDDAFPSPLRQLVRWSRDPRVLGPLDPPSLLVVEPPDHTRYRRLVARAFTARAVESLRPDVEQVADELLDALERGPRPTDLVASYATLLPVTVIGRLLGVPRGELGTVLGYGEQVAPSLDIALGLRRFREVQEGLRGFNAWVENHLGRLRREPGDDLLSRLVAGTNSERLTGVELRSVAGLLLAAGFETTVNLLGSGVELLLRHPSARVALRDDPALWPNAVEEVLRYESPVQVTARFATRDTGVDGVAVAAGSLVVTMLGGANRDPEVFAAPDRFDVRRGNAREHLAFSAGRHFCLGAALARLEGEVGLRALFERYPGLEPAGRPVRRPTRVLRGWASLPVTLGAPARVISVQPEPLPGSPVAP